MAYHGLMARARLLVVEDDQDIATVVKAYLEHDDFQVEVASDGGEGLARALSETPDLVVLDWMLPGMDGIEVLTRLRAASEVPVIMLTARGEHDDLIEGLSVGADDYLSKPFHPPELVARITAVLRRSHRTLGDAPLRLGEMTIDVAKQKVTMAGDEVPLTALEFDLLLALAAAPGRVFSRNELLDRVWGRDFVGVDRVVDVHVFKLRQKLERQGGASLIETVRGVGYRFSEAAP